MIGQVFRGVKYALIMVLLAVPSYATTFIWDHDCEDTVGFKVYYEDAHLIAEVLCPDTSITVTNAIDGNYTVKAYNSTDESDPSNEVLLAEYYYNSIKYDFDSNSILLYKGEHTDHDAVDSDTNWVVTKYYYTNGIVSAMRIRTTSWSNRISGW